MNKPDPFVPRREKSVRCRRRARQGGFSLIDVLVALTIFSISAAGFLGVALSSLSLKKENENLAAANAMTRMVFEEMRSQDFDLLFALFNDDPKDDPVGIAAPGSRFTRQNFYRAFGTATQKYGTVNTQGVGNNVADMESVEAVISFPSRDLDGDGAVDVQDLTAGYELLPVMVQINWVVNGRPHQTQVQTILQRGD